MKRLIILLLLCAISFIGYSQSPGVTKSFALKTLTNTTADTHTITNGSIWNIVIQGNPWKYYEIVGTGTSGDTTLVTIHYILK